MAKLTPFGVFAVVASAAGTMSFEELARLQVFLGAVRAHGGVADLLALPGPHHEPHAFDVSSQVVGATRDVLITAFATGSALIVLPLIN